MTFQTTPGSPRTPPTSQRIELSKQLARPCPLLVLATTTPHPAFKCSSVNCVRDLSFARRGSSGPATLLTNSNNCFLIEFNAAEAQLKFEFSISSQASQAEHISRRNLVMFYPSELPRPRRPIYGDYGGKTGLIHTPQKNGSRGPGKIMKILLPYLKDYAAESSVHGIRYLAEPKMRNFER